MEPARNPSASQRMRTADATRMQRMPYPLTARAAALLAELPDSLDVDTLRTHYPDVLDQVAACWNEAPALARTFDELLFATNRGGTRLPLSALLELTALQSHAATRLPRRRGSVWEQALDRLA